MGMSLQNKNGQEKEEFLEGIPHPQFYGSMGFVFLYDRFRTFQVAQGKGIPAAIARDMILSLGWGKITWKGTATS